MRRAKKIRQVKAAAGMSVQINDQFQLLGAEVTLEEAEALKAQGLALLEQAATDAQSPLVADFGGLQAANSVTVAIMIAWHRAAMRQQKSIAFVNLSAELTNIIEFSGLSTVLTRTT